MPSVPPEYERTLKELLGVFLAENAKLNLSAYRSEEHCWIGNVLDSLAFLDVAPTLFGKDWRHRHLRIADAGTGGGFPLLPLALAMPQARFTGIDATRKKLEAVERMVRALKLHNVALLTGRIEELAHEDGMRGAFDCVLARAVAPIAVLLEYCVPLLKLHGRCVLWKSVHIAEEIRRSAAASKLLHTSIVNRYTYSLPGGFGDRELLVYEKEAETPEEYPRGIGVPKAKPL